MFTATTDTETLSTLAFEPLADIDSIEDLTVTSIVPPVGPCGVLLLNSYTPDHQHITVAVSAGDSGELIFEKAMIR